MILIGFCGERGSGKDTACDALVFYHNFHKVAFADRLRRACQIKFDLTMEEMIDPILKEKPLNHWPFMSPRDILKVVGTEGFRDHFPGVHIRGLFRTADQLKRVVVSDCRFADEAEAIKTQNGVLVRIHNPSVEVNNDTHRSEADWRHFDFDAELVNDAPTAIDWQMKVSRWWLEYSKLLAPN